MQYRLPKVTLGSLLILFFLVVQFSFDAHCQSKRIISKLRLPPKALAKPTNDPTVILLRKNKVNLEAKILLKKNFGIRLDKKLYYAEQAPRFSSSFNSKLNNKNYQTTLSGKLTSRGDKSSGTYFVSYYYSKKTKRTTLAVNFKLPNNKEFTIKGYSKGKKQNLVLAEIKNHSSKGLHCEQNSTGYSESSESSNAEPNTFVNYTSNPTLKLLVAYSPDALAKAGGTLAGIQTIINFEVARLNQSLQDSGVNLTVQNSCPPYAIPTSRNDDLSDVLALYENGDGWADGVHQARINCGADLVHLMYGGSTGGGYGNIFNQGQSIAKASRLAFSGTIINDFLLSSSKGFAHEIGHNLGCAHHADYTTGHGYYTDSHGHRFTGTNNVVYTDIMTYVYPGGQSASIFSNPNITYQGTASGVTGSADLAKTLNITGGLASQFRNYLIPPSGSLSYTFSKTSYSANILVTPSFTQTNDVDLSGHQLNSYYKDDQGNWVYSGTFPIVNSYGAVLNSEKTWKFALYPDTYLSTSEINPVKASSLNIAANLSGNVLSGNITNSNNNPIYISGNWIQVQFRYASSDPSTPFETLVSIPTNSSGAFSHTISVPGYYKLNIVTDTGDKSSSTFLFSSPTATPTAIATFTPTNTIPPTLTPTATSTNTAIATNTKTATPTYTPVLIPSIQPTNSAIPTINVPTAIPIATPTPVGDSQYTLTIKQSKVSKAKVLLTGSLFEDGVPISLANVQLKCNRPIKKNSTITNALGRYRLIQSRPIIKSMKCYVGYKIYRSSTITIYPVIK